MEGTWQNLPKHARNPAHPGRLDEAQTGTTTQKDLRASDRREEEKNSAQFHSARAPELSDSERLQDAGDGRVHCVIRTVCEDEFGEWRREWGRGRAP